MADSERFREMLRDAIYRIQSYEGGKRVSLIQDELGRALGKEGEGSAIEYWRGGKIPSPYDLKLLVEEIVRRSDLDRQWVMTFLQSADYLHADAFCDELFGRGVWEDSSQSNSVDGHEISESRAHPDRSIFEILEDSLGRFLTRIWNNNRSNEVSGGEDDVAVDQKILRKFGTVLDSITPRKILLILVFSTLWIASVELAMPILRWPFADSTELLWACMRYAAATLLLPAVISLVAPVDISLEQRSLSIGERRSLVLLKFSGALVGYAGLSGALLYVVGVSFHLGYSICATNFCNVLVLIPIFFSFASARYIPHIRNKWYGSPKFGEVDKLFLSVFIFFGPLLSLFIYYGYPVITQRMFGFGVIGAGIGLAMLEIYRRQDSGFSERSLILYVGLGLPVGLLVLAFFNDRTIASFPSFLEWKYFFITMLYFLSFSLLGATLLVRRLYILTLRGMLGLLGVLLVILVALNLDIWLGRLLFALGALGWATWGRVRFKLYLYLHPSLWLMFLALFCSIGIGLWTNIPLWINALSFASLSLLFLYWANYRASAISSKSASASSTLKIQVL